MKRKLKLAAVTFQKAHDELAQACRDTGITTTKDDRELLAMKVVAKALQKMADGAPVMTIIRDIRNVAVNEI